MSNSPLGIAFAQQIYFATNTDIASVTDGSGTFTVTAESGYYRWLLTETVAGGADKTEEHPKNLIEAVDDDLGPNWVFSMNANGKLQFRYTGTGTASISWSSDTVRKLFGWAAGVTIPTGTTQTAPSQPTHIAYAISEESGDGMFRPVGKNASMPSSRSLGGKVRARFLGFIESERETTLAWLPRDETIKSLIGSEESQLEAPGNRWSAPTDAVGSDYPWSWNDLIYSSAGKDIAVTFGDLQAIISGTSKTIHICRVSEKTLSDGKISETTSKETDMYHSVTIELSRWKTSVT